VTWVALGRRGSIISSPTGCRHAGVISNSRDQALRRRTRPPTRRPLGNTGHPWTTRSGLGTSGPLTLVRTVQRAGAGRPDSGRKDPARHEALRKRCKVRYGRGADPALLCNKQRHRSRVGDPWGFLCTSFGQGHTPPNAYSPRTTDRVRRREALETALGKESAGRASGVFLHRFQCYRRLSRPGGRRRTKSRRAPWGDVLHAAGVAVATARCARAVGETLQADKNSLLLSPALYQIRR